MPVQKSTDSTPDEAPQTYEEVGVYKEKLRLLGHRTFKTIKQLASNAMGLVGLIILVFFGVLAVFGPVLAPYPTPAPAGSVSPVVEAKWQTPDKFATAAPSYVVPIQWAIPLIGSLAASLLIVYIFTNVRARKEQTAVRNIGYPVAVAGVVFSAVTLAVVALDAFAGVNLGLGSYMFPVVVAASALALLGTVLALYDDTRKSRIGVAEVVLAPAVTLIPLAIGLEGSSLATVFLAVSIVSGVLLILAASTMRTLTKKRAMKLAAQKDAPPDLASANMALVGAVLSACLATVVIVSGFIGYLAQNWTTHWMGTDTFGWDIYSELLYGAQTSVIVGIFSAIIASVLGALVGLYSGYVGGWADEVIMRINDVILSIPWLVLMIVIAGAISASTGGEGINLTSIILIIGVTGWSPTARMVRAQVLSIRERQYIERAKSIGAGDFSIIRRHVLPNAFPLVFANTILTVAVSILSEATLSFLGLRPVGVVTWGTMLSFAQADNAFAIGLYAWEIMPGLCIVVIVLGFTLLGYALDDILNPKLRKR